MSRIRITTMSLSRLFQDLFPLFAILLSNINLKVHAQEIATNNVPLMNLNGYQCFQTRDELYIAVTQYSYDQSPNSTSVANYGPIEQWCVGAITDFSNLFTEIRTFNAAIGNWDVSSATDMSSMFFKAPSFNQNLSQWNVAKVTSFENMFTFAVSFRGIGLENWDVSSATSLSVMFGAATLFNADLNQWNTSNVNQMIGTFGRCRFFESDLSQWDVSKVTNMAGMFANATNFTSDLSQWNVGRVTDMTSTFRGATSFNSNLSKWDVSKVTSFQSMFQNATSFNTSLCAWGPQMQNRNISDELDPSRLNLMFLNSGCVSEFEPDLNFDPVEPLCHWCGINGTPANSLENYGTVEEPDTGDLGVDTEGISVAGGVGDPDGILPEVIGENSARQSSLWKLLIAAIASPLLGFFWFQ